MASLFDFDALPSFGKESLSASQERQHRPSTNASEFTSPAHAYSSGRHGTNQKYDGMGDAASASAKYSTGNNGGHAKIDGAVVQQRFLNSPSPRKPLDPLATIGGGNGGGGLFSPFHRKVMAGDAKRGDEDGDLEDYQSAAPLTRPKTLAPPARAQAAGPVEAAPSADSYVRLEDIMNAPLFSPSLPPPSLGGVSQPQAQPQGTHHGTHHHGKPSTAPAAEGGAKGRQSRAPSLEPVSRGNTKPVAFRKSYDIVLGGPPTSSTSAPATNAHAASSGTAPSARGPAGPRAQEYTGASARAGSASLPGPGNSNLLQSFRARLAALADEVEDLQYEVRTGQASPRRDRAGSLPLYSQRLSALTMPSVPGIGSPIASLLPGMGMGMGTGMGGRGRAPSTAAASLGSELPSLASPPNELADGQDVPLLYGAAGRPQAVHAAIGAMFAEAHGLTNASSPSKAAAAAQKQQEKGSSPNKQVPTSSQFYSRGDGSGSSSLASGDMSDLRLRAAALIPVTMAQVASDIVTGKVWDRMDEGMRAASVGSPARAGPTSVSSPSNARAALTRSRQAGVSLLDGQREQQEGAASQRETAAALHDFNFEDTHARGFEEAGALLSTPMPASRHGQAGTAGRTAPRPLPRTAHRSASLPPPPKEGSPPRSPEQRAAGIAQQQAAAQAGKVPRYLAPTKARMESMTAQAALLSELSHKGQKDMRKQPPAGRRASIAGSTADRQVGSAAQAGKARRSSLAALPTAPSSSSALPAGKGGGRSTSVPPRAVDARNKAQAALPPTVPAAAPALRGRTGPVAVTVRGRPPAPGRAASGPGSGTVNAAHSSASQQAPGARAVLRRDSAASSLLQDAPRAMDLLRRIDAARREMVTAAASSSALTSALASTGMPRQAASSPPAGKHGARFTTADDDEGAYRAATVISSSPPDLPGREFIANRLAHLQVSQRAHSKGTASTSPRPTRSEQTRSTVKKSKAKAEPGTVKSPAPSRTPRNATASPGSAGAEKAQLLASLLLRVLNGTGPAGEAALKSIHSGSVSPAVLTALLPLLEKLDESEGSMSKLRTRTAYLEALLRQLAEQTAKASASDKEAVKGLQTLSQLQDILAPYGSAYKGSSPARRSAEAASRAATDKAVLELMNVGSSPYKAAGSTSHPDGMAYKDVLTAALSLSTGGGPGREGQATLAQSDDVVGRAMQRVDAKFEEVDPRGHLSPRPVSGTVTSSGYAQAQAKADLARANELGATLSPLRNASDIKKALAEARQAAEVAASYTREMSSGPVDENDPLRAPIPSAASVLAQLGLDSEGRITASQGAAMLDAAAQQHKIERSRNQAQPTVSHDSGQSSTVNGPLIDVLTKQAVAAANVAFGDTNSGINAAKALVAAKLVKAEETLTISAAVMAKEAKASAHPSFDDLLSNLLPGYAQGGSMPSMPGVIAGMVRDTQLGQDADVRKALADAPFVSMRMPLPSAPGQGAVKGISSTATAGAASAGRKAGKCAECETVTASRQCHECNDAFCDMCYTALHRKGARKEHLWTKIDGAQSEQAAASPERPATSAAGGTPAFMSPGTLAQFDIGDPLALERMVQKAVAESGTAYMAATSRMAEEMRKPLGQGPRTATSPAAATKGPKEKSEADPHPMLSLPPVQLGPGMSSLSLELFKRVYAASGGPEDMHKKAQLLTDAAKAREEAAALGIQDPLSMALTLGNGSIILSANGEADIVSTQLAQQAETAIAAAVGHASDRAKAGGLVLSGERGKQGRGSSPSKVSSASAAGGTVPRPATPAVDVVVPMDAAGSATGGGQASTVLTRAQLAELSKSLLSGLDDAPRGHAPRARASSTASGTVKTGAASGAYNRAEQSTQRFLARMQVAAGKREAK